MKILKFFTFLLCSFMSWLKADGQWNNYEETPMNYLEFQALGNRGFLTFIYNRTVYEHPHFAVIINAAFGRIPGSHDMDTIPSLGHFGLGTGIIYKLGLNGIFAGVSYCGLLRLEQDKANAESKNYRQGLLGDLGYIRFFRGGTFLKFSFTPVLLGKEYGNSINIPFGLSGGFSF